MARITVEQLLSLALTQFDLYVVIYRGDPWAPYDEHVYNIDDFRKGNIPDAEIKAYVKSFEPNSLYKSFGLFICIE